MEYKVTRAKQIFEVNNEKCLNYYWLFNVQFKDEIGTIARAKFILWDDIEDICDYYTDEDAEEYVSVNKTQIREYMLDRAYSTLSSYFGWNGENKKLISQINWDDFNQFCKKTIDDYND